MAKKKASKKATPKKPVTRLSKKLREQIKSNYHREHKADYSGEALVYLNRVRGAAKARRKKAGARAEFSNIVIPKNSIIYHILLGVAKQKGITVAEVLKKYPDVLSDYMKRGRFTLIREIEYLIEDVDSTADKVFIKSMLSNAPEKEISKATAKQWLRRLKQKMTKTIINIYPDIFIRHYYDGYGHLHLTIPEPGEYRNIKTSDDLMFFIDKYYAKFVMYNLRQKR